MALFELVPGRGIVQLYPLTKYEATYLVEPGYRQMIPARADMARRVSWQAGIAVRQFTPGFHAGVPAPVSPASKGPQGFLPYRHVVAIASDKPLRVGTPSATMSYLHLAVPALWTPAAFEAGPSDLEALIDAVVPAGATSGVSAIRLAPPRYTMVTYSPLAWALVNPWDDTDEVWTDDRWASCFGMRIRVPSWYLGEAFCNEPPKTQTPQVAASSLPVAPIGLVHVSAPTVATRIADLPMREVPALTPVERAGPNDAARARTSIAEMGAGGGRDVRSPTSGGEARAGAPGTTGAAAPSRSPRREEGAGAAPAPAPTRAPAPAAGAPSSGSRERPVP